jgi:ankyrin repeat protein
LKLINRGADPNVECDDRDENGGYLKWTPLIVVSFKGSLEIARALLEYGANVNRSDRRGRSPVHTISRCSYDDLLQLLFDHGANHNISDYRDETALHQPSFDGGPGVVRLLLDKGLDVNARSKWGWNPLQNEPDLIFSEG